MSDHVYKSVEITGSSPEGVTQAIDRAVAKASETLRNLDWFELTSVRGQIADGKVAHYQATLKIGFRLEDQIEGSAPRRAPGPVAGRQPTTKASARGGRPPPSPFGGPLTARRGGQLGQVGELGEPVLAGAEQEVVDRERRVERVRGARRRCRRSRRRTRRSAPPRPASARTRRPGRACVAPPLRNASWSCARASQPVRSSSQPPSGSAPCSASKARMSST